MFLIFVGIDACCRKFIPNCSNELPPLTNLNEKGVSGSVLRTECKGSPKIWKISENLQCYRVKVPLEPMYGDLEIFLDLVRFLFDSKVHFANFGFFQGGWERSKWTSSFTNISWVIHSHWVDWLNNWKMWIKDLQNSHKMQRAHTSRDLVFLFAWQQEITVFLTFLFCQNIHQNKEVRNNGNIQIYIEKKILSSPSSVLILTIQVTSSLPRRIWSILPKFHLNGWVNSSFIITTVPIAMGVVLSNHFFSTRQCWHLLKQLQPTELRQLQVNVCNLGLEASGVVLKCENDKVSRS